MKTFLDKSQHRELKSVCEKARTYRNFGIHEMLSILPKTYKGSPLMIVNNGEQWIVSYQFPSFLNHIQVNEKELIDALFAVYMGTIGKRMKADIHLSIDDVELSLDLFLNAGIKRGYAHRIYFIADEGLGCKTLGDLYRATRSDILKFRNVGRKTISIIEMFFYDNYQLVWN